MASLASSLPLAPAPAAAARRGRRSVSAAALASSSSQPQPQPQQAHAVDRRALLLGAGAAAAAVVLPGAAPAPAAAAAAPSCTELTTAPSGLQFCDIAVGEGEAPVAGARIRAHYTGRLASNGAVFDSSYERGRPLVFQIGVGQVIKGWDEGILGGEGVPPMRPGGRRRLVIPADLGYGARGAGGVIPPGATLDFLVEYLGKQGAR